MTISIPDVLVIPYGTSDWSPEGMTIEGFTAGTLRVRTAFPCIAVNRAAGEPLRFNNSPYALGYVPDRMADSADQAGLIKGYLKRLCSPWDRLSHAFLDAYFAFISERLEDDRDHLEAQLAPYAGLFAYRDWFFSAPKPLPRAHLYAPPLAEAPTGTASDFVQVDFAMWLGSRLVAVQSTQTTSTPRKAREIIDRLRTASIEVVPVSGADLSAGPRDLFRRLLQPLGERFWDGEPLPAGPFRTTRFGG